MNIFGAELKCSPPRVNIFTKNVHLQEGEHFSSMKMFISYSRHPSFSNLSTLVRYCPRARAARKMFQCTTYFSNGFLEKKAACSAENISILVYNSFSCEFLKNKVLCNGTSRAQRGIFLGSCLLVYLSTNFSKPS